ncbi:MAG: type II toxin-antitoxin system RelE/ParE family toxin [Terracidiphilus sp.]|jgi:phage-related protein
MGREFVPFNEDTIRKELDGLPPKDAAKLAALMDHYEHCGLGNPSPAQVDDYGDGIYRLRHVKPAYQGRLLFFTSDRSSGFEELVMLAVYKKQGQKAPRHILEAAKKRKKQWEETRGKA